MDDSEETPQCPCCRGNIDPEPIVDDDSCELPTSKSQARPAPETPEEDDCETQPHKNNESEIPEPKKPCYSKTCPKDPIIVLSEQPLGKYQFVLSDKKNACKTTLSETERYQQERETPIFGEQTAESVKSAFDTICKKTNDILAVTQNSNDDNNENSTLNISTSEANKKIDFVEISSPKSSEDVITVIEKTKSKISSKLNSAIETLTQNLPEKKDIFSIKDKITDQSSNYDVPVKKTDLMTPKSSEDGVLKQIKRKISSFFSDK